MSAVHESPWLRHLREIPDDAAIPLAMSGPHPDATGSFGSQCIAWARDQGLMKKPRWWQDLAIHRELEHDDDGTLIWPEYIESGPRRIGKSVRLRISTLFRVAHPDLFGEPQLSMLVSKDLAIGKEIHSGSWRWAKQHGWNVVRLGGAQEVESPEGSRWLLRADTAVYGYDIGSAKVDESWAVDPQAITDGLEPAMLERCSPQLGLTSTAHVRATSLMRRRLLAAIRESDPNVLLMLWGAHPDADIANEQTWRAASPHWSQARRDLMARKYAAALAGEADPEIDDPDPVRGWAAQYLNVWPMLLNAGGIFPTWSDLSTEPPSTPTPLALGIATPQDHSWLSLGAVVEGDPVHLAVRDRVRVTARPEFVANVARIQRQFGCPVLVRAKNFLVGDLEDAGVDLTVVTGDEFAQASTDLGSEVEAATVTHGDYPELNSAVASASWRYIDNRKLLETRHSDISVLEAVALALRGARSGPSYDLLSSVLI